MIKRSFSEFSSQRLQPEQKNLLAKIEAKLQSLEKIDCIFGEPDIENFHALHSELKSVDADLQQTILSTRSAQQLLSMPGRVVLVTTKVRPKSFPSLNSPRSTHIQ